MSANAGLPFVYGLMEPRRRSIHPGRREPDVRSRTIGESNSLAMDLVALGGIGFGVRAVREVVTRPVRSDGNAEKSRAKSPRTRMLRHIPPAGLWRYPVDVLA